MKTRFDGTVWIGAGGAAYHPSEMMKQSLFNITSMTPEQVSSYALNSPLGTALKMELYSRGVNVENYLSMVEAPETL